MNVLAGNAEQQKVAVSSVFCDHVSWHNYASSLT
jgi:hypothetical protein